MPITTKVLSLNPAHGRVYSIQHYVRKFVRSVVFSRYSDLDEILFPSRLWCCELISIVGLLWWPFWIQNGHQYTKIQKYKMATNKIVKLSMVSDFNENWYLGVFWSAELVVNDETCIHMPEFWYGVRLETSVFASKHNQT